MTRTWPQEWRDEYDQTLREVCESVDGTGDRADALQARVEAAVADEKPWAKDVETDALHRGYIDEITVWLKRHRVVFSLGSRRVRKPRVIGTRRRGAEGEPVDYQLPFVTLTFDELRTKRRAYLQQMRSYGDDIALMDRLLALAERVPAAETPTEAARSLHLDLDEYLAGAS